MLWAEVGGTLPECQYRFRKGKSTLDSLLGKLCLLVFQDSIASSFICVLRRHPASISFCIGRSLLLAHLLDIGVSVKFVDLIAEMFNENTFRLKTESLFSPSAKIKVGVYVKAVCSPLFFSYCCISQI
jgi:hypothetical protein